MSLIKALGEKKASNADKTAFTIDPWSTGGDPWATFAATAVSKKAKKEELAEDLAEGFGLGITSTATNVSTSTNVLATGSSSAASASSGMSLSAEAAAIIAAVNGNTDQKVALVTGRLDRHEGLIVDLGARVVALERDKALTSAASVSSGAAASTAAGASTSRLRLHSGNVNPIQPRWRRGTRFERSCSGVLQTYEEEASHQTRWVPRQHVLGANYSSARRHSLRAPRHRRSVPERADHE